MKEDIQAGNKLIAEFMGGYIEVGKTTKKNMYSFLNNIEFCESLLPQTKDGNYLFFEKELLFHTSWDWLMPVVEKIETLFNAGIVFHIKDNRAYIEVDTQASIAFDIPDVPECYSGFCKTKIDAAYSTVIQFIQWLNNEKTGN